MDEEKNIMLTNQKKAGVYTVAGNVSWCSHYGKQYGGSSKN